MLSFILTSRKVKGQSDAIDFQPWGDVSYSYTLLNRKVILASDIGFRGFVAQLDWSQFFIRSNFKYLFNQEFNLAGGLAFFRTWDKNEGNIGELRFFERATINWPTWAFVGISHRFQYEQRLLNYQNTDFSFTNAYSSRLRYLLMTETKDFTIINQKIYFKLGFELFHSRFNGIDLIFDSDRIITGVGHRVSDHFKYEIHYMLQQSRLDRINGFETSAHVLRLRLFFRNEKATSSQ